MDELNQKTFSAFLQPVDWSWNQRADKKFQFMDHYLVAHIRSKKDKEATEFFKLLSLCHTVMVEHKDGNLKIRIWAKMNMPEWSSPGKNKYCVFS